MNNILSYLYPIFRENFLKINGNTSTQIPNPSEDITRSKFEKAFNDFDKGNPIKGVSQQEWETNFDSFLEFAYSLRSKFSPNTEQGTMVGIVASPLYKAYGYQGHSKTDIKASTIDQALLYEY